MKDSLIRNVLLVIAILIGFIGSFATGVFCSYFCGKVLWPDDYSVVLENPPSPCQD